MMMDIPMENTLPRNVPCECGGIMNQDMVSKFRNLSFNIPCTFNDETYSPKKYDDSSLTDYMDSLDG